MDLHESPESAFRVILNRFTREELGKMVFIYDNACNAQLYGCKRFPRAIQHIRFHLDSRRLAELLTEPRATVPWSAACLAQHPAVNLIVLRAASAEHICWRCSGADCSGLHMTQ
jgi:hypothetical protein